MQSASVFRKVINIMVEETKIIHSFTYHNGININREYIYNLCVDKFQIIC